MAETAPLNSYVAASFLAPKDPASLFRAQQQEALAQALLQQGNAPISTEGRQIGGVGYQISPWEGVAKLGQLLSGGVTQNFANEKLAKALEGGMAGGPTSAGSSADPIISSMPGPTQALFNRLTLPESMGGNPRAAIDLYGQYAAGMKSYNTKTGENAAGAAPYGALPAGVGEATPPIDIQMSQSAVPVGSNTAAPTIPPIAASALQPGVQSTLSRAANIPAPNLQGMTNDQAKIALGGAKNTAEKSGDNLADAQKTFNVAAGNLPRAMQRFDQLRSASNDASYGGGVSEEPAGTEFHLISPDYAREYARTSLGQFTEPKRATANQTIEQAASQGILSELGPQLAGLRGNKFLESIASTASGLNPSDPPAAKQNAINGLQDQYISNLKSLADQRRSYGDPNAPSDMDLAHLISQNASPQTMVNVMDPKGRLGKVSAAHLPDLIKDGGQIK